MLLKKSLTDLNKNKGVSTKINCP